MKKIGLIGSFAVYIPAAVLMYCMTSFCIPYLAEKTGHETILFWFVVSGLGVFIPLIITGLLILKSEGTKISKKTWVERLRFRKTTRRDLLWSFIGIVFVVLTSGLLMKGLEGATGRFDRTPPFMSFAPLSDGRYWLLAAWFPYWILNILGEEFLWRGVMLPRQELSFGRWTWMIHGLGWGLFHVAFGWHLLATLTPLLFIQSYVVQKTKNTWTGVIMHGCLNGPSFIAISFGLL